MSADGLKVAQHDGILVLTLVLPPQSSLTADLRATLLREVSARPEAYRAVVLHAEGPAFFGQLPIDADRGQPDLATLCRAVAECPVPVVAALQGFVTGPGAELALAARARIADSGCRISFADVTLGLCPSGGASQRLPRLIGARAALRLLLSGQSIPAAEALSLGLIDRIADGAPLAAALQLAMALAAGQTLSRAPQDPVAWQAAVKSARQDLGRPQPVAKALVNCVEAALLLPKENGFAFEAAQRADLEISAEAMGLRAAARAERSALRTPTALARLQPLAVDRLGLAGQSGELARIAVAALSRDMAVTWVFESSAARREGLAAVEAGIGAGQRAGRLSDDRARAMSSRLLAVDDPALLAPLAFVVQGHLTAPTPLAANRAGAAHLVLGGGAREIGLALAPAGRAVEVSLPGTAPPLSRVTALAGLRRVGLAPVIVGSRPMVGARMADAGRTALAFMIARGVPQRLIVAVLDRFGMPSPDPISVEPPATLRAMPEAEVLNRWLAALANEGARLLEDGFAHRPSDIDHLMVAGFGFPRWQGGPMHQADRRGLMVLRADLRAWGTDAALWRPAALFDRLIGEGRSFAALDGDRP